MLALMQHAYAWRWAREGSLQFQWAQSNEGISAAPAGAGEYHWQLGHPGSLTGTSGSQVPIQVR